MKLLMACVAAVSLFGCADDPGTSGDSEISVVGTKTDQVRGERLIGTRAIHFDAEDVRFSERVGIWAETFFPPVNGLDEHACENCELTFVHQSDGRIDNTEIWDDQGNFVCVIRQTTAAVILNTCDKFRSAI